jgi:hypothetical protein
LYLGAQGTLQFTVANGSVSKVEATSPLQRYTGTIALDLSGTAPAQNAVIDLIYDSGASLPSTLLNGSYLQLDPSDVGIWALQIGTTGGHTGDTLQAVYLLPEPATMGLLAIGLAGLAALRRRRK